MPDRLTLGATLVLVAVALGLAFGASVLVGGGASAAKPIAKRGPALVPNTPGPVMDLGITAVHAVPALRASRKRALQRRRSAGVARRSGTPAVKMVSAPVIPAGSARPTPTAVPRPVASPPPRVDPAPKPKPEPTPIAKPESPSDLDTTGDFDTTGEAASEGADQIPHTNRTSGGVAK